MRVKYTFFMLGLHETSIFLTDFLKTIKYQISRKSFQFKTSRSMRTDRQTRMTKLAAAILRTRLKTKTNTVDSKPQLQISSVSSIYKD